MTIQDLYEFSIARGMALDPRGPAEIERQLAAIRAQFALLPEEEKPFFEHERLNNPFGDTRIVNGDPATEVKRILCGINISEANVLLADRLRDHGKPVDLVVGHHTGPLGGACGSMRDTVWPQIAMMTHFGLPPAQAEELLIRSLPAWEERTLNYEANQVAQALGMPCMTIHSPVDTYAWNEAQRVIHEDCPTTVGELIEICDAWPELRWMRERGKGSEIVVGDRHAALGKVYAEFYGGMGATAETVEAIFQAGCNTLWAVWTNAERNALCQKYGVTNIVSPHYPIDNLGINMFFDDAMNHFGDFDIVPVSNYVRFDRR